jgi:hypothetical protein
MKDYIRCKNEYMFLEDADKLKNDINIVLNRMNKLRLFW